MKESWEVIAPWVLGLIGLVTGGATVGVVIRALVGTFVKNVSANMATTYNTELLARKVAELIAGKTVGIDVTAITEERLEEIEKTLADAVAEVANETNAQKYAVALLCEVMRYLKAIPEDERVKLDAAAKALNSEYVAPKKIEPVTVKLEKLETAKSNEAGKAGLNLA